MKGANWCQFRLLRPIGTCAVALFASLILTGATGFAEEQKLIGDPVKGLALYKKSLCVNCHIVDHEAMYEPQPDGSKQLAGGRVGPDLTQVGHRRTEEHLQDFIFEPTDVFLETPMPQFPWNSKQEAADVAAFLLTAKKPVDSEAILSSAASKVEAGEKLVKAYDCRACHTILTGGRPGTYPDLSHIGSKIYPEWEHIWLRDPQEVKDGTFMPTFHFQQKEKEISAIVAYLESLK